MPNIYPYGVIASIFSTLPGGKVEAQTLLHSFHLFIIKYRKLKLAIIEIKYEKLAVINMCKVYKLVCGGDNSCQYLLRITMVFVILYKSRQW